MGDDREPTQDAGLVGTEARIVEKKPIIHYILTKRGTTILRHFEALIGQIEDAPE